MQADLMATLYKGRKKVGMVLRHHAGHEEAAFDSEPIQEIEDAPDPNPRAEEPLLHLANDAGTGLALHVPKERGFRIHVDRKAESAGFACGPLVRSPGELGHGDITHSGCFFAWWTASEPIELPPSMVRVAPVT